MPAILSASPESEYRSTPLRPPEYPQTPRMVYSVRARARTRNQLLGACLDPAALVNAAGMRKRAQAAI